MGTIYCIISLFYFTYKASGQEQVDKEHLKLYPYCGRLFGWDSKRANSRVVNSHDSVEYELYPWVVFVSRTYKTKQNIDDVKICSGTVIAYK